MSSFNFRATSSYVIDGINETFVSTSDLYPTIRDGRTFGWVIQSGGLSQRDRRTTVDSRLAGCNETYGSSFFITESGAGIFRVTFAGGDAVFAGNNEIAIIETDNNNDLVQILAVIADEQPNGGGEFFDAVGVLRTSASDWVDNNETIDVTVAEGNNLAIRLGDPAAAGASNPSKITHFSYEPVVPSVVSVDTDNSVEDGQQNVSVEVETFSNDITLMSLISGSYSIILNGLSGTGTIYSIDLPDVTTFTENTPGVPFSGDYHDIELEVTDGVDTGVGDITLSPKPGWALQKITNASTDQGSWFAGRVTPPVNNSQILYETKNNTLTTGEGFYLTDEDTFIKAVLFHADTGIWEPLQLNFVTPPPGWSVNASEWFRFSDTPFFRGSNTRNL